MINKVVKVRNNVRRTRFVWAWDSGSIKLGATPGGEGVTPIMAACLEIDWSIQCEKKLTQRLLRPRTQGLYMVTPVMRREWYYFCSSARLRPVFSFRNRAVLICMIGLHPWWQYRLGPRYSSRTVFTPYSK